MEVASIWSQGHACEAGPVQPPGGEGGRPSGTVTFLFTDIEASTRLWGDDHDGMAASLAEHDEILRDRKSVV